jgi:hypothetical protein
MGYGSVGAWEWGAWVDASEVFYLGSCDGGVLLLDGLLGGLFGGLAVMVLEESVQVAIVVVAVLAVHSQQSDLLFAGKAVRLVDLLDCRRGR